MIKKFFRCLFVLFVFIACTKVEETAQVSKVESSDKIEVLSNETEQTKDEVLPSTEVKASSEEKTTATEKTAPDSIENLVKNENATFPFDEEYKRQIQGILTWYYVIDRNTTPDLAIILDMPKTVIDLEEYNPETNTEVLITNIGSHQAIYTQDYTYYTEPGSNTVNKILEITTINADSYGSTEDGREISTREYIYSFEYDSQNRIKSIIYGKTRFDFDYNTQGKIKALVTSNDSPESELLFDIDTKVINEQEFFLPESNLVIDAFKEIRLSEFDYGGHWDYLEYDELGRLKYFTVDYTIPTTTKPKSISKFQYGYIRKVIY